MSLYDIIFYVCNMCPVFCDSLLMWGYTKIPVNEGLYREDWRGVLNNFGMTVVPSLLFGALISATDPGKWAGSRRGQRKGW